MTRAWDSMGVRPGVFAVLAFLAASIAAPAAAQLSENDQRARVLFEAGTLHYENGRYEQALAQFDAAYELSPRPILLYNIALARERMGDQEGALEAFEQFLETDAEAPNIDRAALENRVEALRGRIERIREQQQQQAEPQSTDTTGSAVDPMLTTEPEPAGGDDTGLIIGLSVGAGVLVAVAITLIAVFAGQGESPYQGTLFSVDIP